MLQRLREESLDKLKDGFEATKAEFESKLTSHETEVKKLGKSRDRLKSLLDEKVCLYKVLGEIAPL